MFVAFTLEKGLPFKLKGMRYEQTLNIRQGAQLALTSRLQQAIGLLQLSSAQLNTFIADQMMENPLLSFEDGEVSPVSSRVDESSDYSPIGTQHREGGENFDLSQTWRSVQSFDEYLESLMRIHFKGADQKIAFWLKSCLNDAGILTEGWSQKVLKLYSNQFDVLEQDTQKVEEQIIAVLKRLQTFEPAGIFATSVVDALRLQMLSKVYTQECEWSLADVELMCHAFEALKEMSFDKVCKSYKIEADTFKCFLLALKQLSFSPASLFDKHERIEHIQSDVIISVDGQKEIQVQLNLKIMPKVLTNSVYYKELTRKIKAPGELAYLKDKLSSAQWLVNALAKRSTTLLQVSIAIANWQKDFLVNGAEMRAMTLKDIAQEAGVHESTVSRITTAKYMETKRGVFELKSFFVNVVGQSDGEGASSIEIQNALRSLINDEQKCSPLSDEDLAALLSSKGLTVARRTVAKYRTLLGIASSSQRKKHYKMNTAVTRSLLLKSS